jgi:hypothetical protein
MSRTFVNGSTYIEALAYYLLSSSSLFHSKRKHERERERWMILFFDGEKRERKREELEK